jgi:hypothetical protein
MNEINLNLIFLDCTCDKNHNSIKKKALGASEYQFYNLIQHFSFINKNKIYCYNFTDGNNLELDNIYYGHFKHLVDHSIDNSYRIIIQRFFPYEEKLRNKILNNNVFLWIHDIPDINIFVGNNQDVINYFQKEPEKFKEYLKDFFISRPSIFFIFNSNHCKNMFIQFLNNYQLSVDNSRLIVIYNILYEDEIKAIKNKEIPLKNNQLVYASAWKKGIKDVIDVFEYIIKKDNKFVLVLMEPGYGMEEYIEYKKDLLTRFPNNIIIHDPLSKDIYSEVIKSSLCVLTSKFNETFGCVFAESYYLGTPVIGDVRSGAVKEIIDNHYIVDYDNKELVFQRLQEIVQNRQNNVIKLSDIFLFKKNFSKWKHIMK